MKKILSLLLLSALLAGCAPKEPSLDYASRFDTVTEIALSDSGIDASGPNAASVFASSDIIYYEDRDRYDSGNPYGEGEDWERHSQAEAQAHTVVNITAPGAYRVSGQLSAGQIRVDLGEDAYEDPNAVVELILDSADITCTMAPAILFLNVYECDGDWDADTAKADVDTTAAGANLILRGQNTVSGSHVARIFKDKDGEKKLWKQDGAIYSYMSMNVYGPGALELTADNEGLDTELHLTLWGGDITIRSGNDGINTNEDGVSVTTINGGNLNITAGLGAEGDGIDSNGYLVINGGTVIAAANPRADAGLDSDLGSFIHGGTVVALGSAMDWAESDSGQVTMNLQFAQAQTGLLSIRDGAGKEIFRYDPGTGRQYQGAILSCGDFRQGDTYAVFVDGVQMAYTGTDVSMGGPGGFGGRPGKPQGQEPPGGFGGQNPPAGKMPTRPEGQEPPAGEMPTWPEGQEPPAGQPPMGGQIGPQGEENTAFFMQDKVNFFSGLAPVVEG